MNNNSTIKSGSLLMFTCIFALSGFSGLIYESIWSHYLKLFLGHSSYAQVLVLGIFMGGMAIGASLASRFSSKWKNLILWYGICEGIIGLLGIGFHYLFISVETLAFESIFPSLGSPTLVHSAKWTLGALLILPQSILLGATFPLLAAGLLRRFPNNSGRTLATLYFVNSFGAAVGILTNAFFFIPKLGLPGSVLTAGLINIVIAIAIYYFSKADHYPAVTKEHTPSNTNIKLLPVLLMVAAFTGLASFMYEIAWIRMLSMVLGGSTHSFEIMLSAFILGLALGSLIIRRYIDTIKHPLYTLGCIQICMGLLAAMTIPMYNQTFSVMGFALDALENSDSGYILFSAFSLIISLLVMLPVTICAGTTLPLVTNILLRNGAHDKTIGKVYAFNTLGSIVGIALAVQIVMPMAGLKSVIVCGAAIDILLGAYLLSKHKDILFRHWSGRLITASLVGVTLMLPFYTLDVEKMASGVFRYGIRHDTSDVIFHKDGKTSTVAVQQDGNIRVLLNNGKPDAGVTIDAVSANQVSAESNNSGLKNPKLAAAKHAGLQNLDKEKTEPQKVTPDRTSDESTMVLLGTLPYVYKPDAKNIANIGLGSGITTHTLLNNPDIDRLDTIEIEQAVLEAASWFRPNVDNLFTDERSYVHIEDAKTFFATAGRTYDVIVSEPPNPWVSGVAGLFTTEFYSSIKRYMNSEAVLVQWIHLYEISPELVGTVYAALSEQFEHIHLYKISQGDLAFVAGQSPLEKNFQSPFKHKKLAEQLEHVNVLSGDDIAFRQLGNKAKLDIFFGPYTKNANSDFFPILDVGAAKTRYKGSNANSVYQLHQSRSLDLLSNFEAYPVGNTTADSYINETIYANAVKQFHGRYQSLKNGLEPSLFSANKVDESANRLSEIINNCDSIDSKSESKVATDNFINLSIWAYPYSTRENLTTVFNDAERCKLKFTHAGKIWIDLHKGWLDKKLDTVKELSDKFLEIEEITNIKTNSHVLIMNMASRVALEDWQGYGKHVEKLGPGFSSDLELRSLIHLANRMSSIKP